LRAVAAAAAAGALVNFAARDALEGSIARVRNYYGIYRVTERVAGSAVVPGAGSHPARYLIHGNTLHGIQASDRAGPHEPAGYYHRATPLGLVLGSRGGPQRVAAIGLGAGTVAAYFAPGDELVFYELDDAGEAIARKWFDYLAESRAAVNVVAGDARISLESGTRAPDGSFDLIFVDAFSGDAVPAHLLTREALELYLRKLRPDGLLLFHISSRLYDFAPVLRASGVRSGCTARTRPRRGSSSRSSSRRAGTRSRATNTVSTRCSRTAGGRTARSARRRSGPTTTSTFSRRSRASSSRAERHSFMKSGVLNTQLFSSTRRRIRQPAFVRTYSSTYQRPSMNT
jgi:SAM-dependent methyltransferase